MCIIFGDLVVKCCCFLALSQLFGCFKPFSFPAVLPSLAHKNHRFFPDQCCQMILAQKRQKYYQTTRFSRQIFQNFVQKAPNFKPKNTKQNYILLHFYATLKPRFAKKEGFFCKKKSTRCHWC